MVIKNCAKEKVYNGEVVYGTFLCLNSTAVSEVLSRVGFDYLIIDMEHGLMSIDTASNMAITMRGSDTMAFMRVEKNDEALIGRALDAGAYGIMVPMINNAKEAEMAVKACKYSPEGHRGVGPGHTCLYGLKLAEYQQAANREVMTILQVEHIDAVNKIEEILEVDGIDVIFIGPSDLASSMNLLGKNDHPQVQEAITTVLNACKKKGVAAGIYCQTAEAAVARVESGFQFITQGLDSRYLSMGASRDLDIMKGNKK